MTRPVNRPANRSATLAAALTLLTAAAMADTPPDADAWTLRKCGLYRAAFGDALAALGPTGLRPAFLDANAAFIASGCTTGTVCAETRQEIALADLLTVMTMNEGMASTFVPFACP